MGANSRITGLSVIQDAEEASLFETLSMVLDDPTYIAGNAKQMRVATLASNRDVPDNTTVGNKFVTEQGLMKTNATYLKKGVVRLAATQDVDSGSGAVALSPDAASYFLDKSTATSYYNGGNISSILDHTFPSNTGFTPSISLNFIGALNIISGGFLISFSGSCLKFEVWFTGLRIPAHETALSVTINDGTTLRPCGATIKASGGFTVLTVHSPIDASGTAILINAIYPAA